MSVWQLPPVRGAVLAVMGEWKTVRSERQDWPPLQALREAKRRHVHELVDAVTAITKAEELAQHGAWKTMPASHGKGEPRSDEYQVTRKEAAAERDQRIREIAAANPDWTHVQIAERLGCGRSTVGAARRSPSAAAKRGPPHENTAAVRCHSAASGRHTPAGARLGSI